MDVFEILTRDHAELTDLCRKLTAETADRTRVEIYNRLKRAVEVHATVEEQLLYPRLRLHHQTREYISDSLREHDEVRTLLTEIGQDAPSDERWMARVILLRDALESHATKEEQEVFPAARAALAIPEIETLTRQVGLQLRKDRGSSPLNDKQARRVGPPRVRPRPPETAP